MCRRRRLPGTGGLTSGEGFSGISWLRRSDAGRAFLSSVPELMAECCRLWSLRLGEPYSGAQTSVVVPAVRADGTEAVLKLQFPDRESQWEGAALARWKGEGAVRLLEADGERRALLLERCRPGTPLHELSPEVALQIMCGILPRLFVPAGHPFTSLAEECRRWASYIEEGYALAGRPFERRLVDVARHLLEELPATQGEQVLLHQDLHAGNVLRAGREPWLVIDPKPLVGEREFQVAPIVRGSELGHSPEQVRRRLGVLVSELSLDMERAKGWTIVQSLAWAFDEDEVHSGHIDVVRWLVA